MFHKQNKGNSSSSRAKSHSSLDFPSLDSFLRYCKHTYLKAKKLDVGS